MSLSIGIVGLPNVGKSTLFNALLKKQQAEMDNRPFTTIEPNVGVVNVPDERLEKLSELVKPESTVAATAKFVDIAGLVEGAHQGEGLGNQFLAHIRETSAVALVVRCFEDSKVTHVAGKVKPADDIRTILVELILADQATLEKLQSAAKKESPEHGELLGRIAEAFSREQTADKVGFSDEERETLGPLPFITAKPLLFAANVNEGDVAHPGRSVLYQEVERLAEAQQAGVVAVSAKIESEIAAMAEDEQREFLKSIGLTESNLDRFVRAAYELLDLQTFYTAGPKEVRAWPLRRGLTARDAAGEIHGDFAEKFIKAEVIPYDDFMKLGSEQAARDAGKLRVEGKDYVVADGDVLHIKHGA